MPAATVHSTIPAPDSPPPVDLTIAATEWAVTATDADLHYAGFQYYVGALDPRGEAYRAAARAELAIRQQRAYDAYIAAGGQPRTPATPNTYRASDRSSD